MKQRKLSILALVVIVPLLIGIVSNTPVVKAAAGFSIIINPGSQNVDGIINQDAYYAIEIQSTGGFVGLVNLTASVNPSGPALSFLGGNTVDVPLDGSAFKCLKATAGPTIPTYTPYYTITVTGTSASPSATGSSTTNLILQPHSPVSRDFTLSTPDMIVDIVPGSTEILLINILSQTSDLNPQSVSLLVVKSVPSMVTAFFTPTVVNVNSYSNNVSNLSVSAALSTPASNYTLVFTGTNNLDIIHSLAITVRVNGFYVSAPLAKSIIRGKSGTVEIGVTSIGTFNSLVTLSSSGVPTNMTATFNPPFVTPPPGATVSSVMTISTTSSLASGTYIIVINGASGAFSSQQTLAVTVGEFIISATPMLKTATQDSTTTFTVNGTSSDSYSSIMNLAVSGLPSGINPTFSPSSITIPPGGSASSTLSLTISATTPVGAYPLNITGTSGSQSHKVDVTLVITLMQDFSLAISPTSSTVRNGSSTAFTISANSINSFSSPVTLTVSIPPGAGATGSISPSSVTPPAGGSATATLTITTSATAPSETVTVTVTGTSGTKTHNATATLTISPTGGRPCIIATATYGSELAPEVYFLRLFRDRSVQSTFAGSQFMNVFNAWYYSFSPTVAEQVKNNMALRNVAKAVIYPLIGTLYLAQWSYSALSFAPELGVFVAGLVASSLIGIVYFAPITALATELARRKRLNISVANKPFAIAWIASAALILSAELSALPGLMMVATAAFVLSTIALAVKATVTQTQRILH